MAPVDSIKTYCRSAIASIRTLCCTIFELFDVQTIVTLNCRLPHSGKRSLPLWLRVSRWLQVTYFDRSHTSSYSSSIGLSYVVSEIGQDIGRKCDAIYHTPLHSTAQLGDGPRWYIAVIRTFHTFGR